MADRMGLDERIQVLDLEPLPRRDAREAEESAAAVFVYRPRRDVEPGGGLPFREERGQGSSSSTGMPRARAIPRTFSMPRRRVPLTIFDVCDSEIPTRREKSACFMRRALSARRIALLCLLILSFLPRLYKTTWLYVKENLHYFYL